MPTSANFFGSLVFGAIGMGALLFGKSMGSARKMIMGAALLACSYLVTDTLVLWVGGALLTVALVMWKD